MTSWPLVVAGGAGGLIALGWIVYPGVLALLSRIRTLPSGSTPPGDGQGVAVIVATRDQPNIVAARARNLRTATYPAALLRVIVAVDVRAEESLDSYQKLLGGDVTVVQGDSPGGKAATLNAGVREATEPLIVFADSRQTFNPEAIEKLVRAFDNPHVGGVTGGYRRPAESSLVLRVFWRYETWLRRCESMLHSVVAVTGCIYAIRRELWKPLPAGAICDDLFVPANVIFQQHRVILCEEAFAVDTRSFSRSEERVRKVRTLTGMLQFCLWEPRAVVPIVNPVFVQFLCHKLLRLATPLLALTAGGAFLWALRSWWPLVGLSALGLGFALWMALLVTGRGKVVDELTWAVQLFFTPLAAVRNAVLGRWEVWQPNHSNSPPPDEPTDPGARGSADAHAHPISKGNGH